MGRACTTHAAATWCNGRRRSALIVTAAGHAAAAWRGVLRRCAALIAMVAARRARIVRLMRAVVPNVRRVILVVTVGERWRRRNQRQYRPRNQQSAFHD